MQATIFDIADDVWFLTFYFLLPTELFSIMPLTCKHFHKLCNMKEHKVQYNKYWEIQCKLLNQLYSDRIPNIIPSHYKAKNWRSLYIQFKGFYGDVSRWVSFHFDYPKQALKRKTQLEAMHCACAFDYDDILKMLLSNDKNYIINGEEPLVQHWMKQRSNGRRLWNDPRLDAALEDFFRNRKYREDSEYYYNKIEINLIENGDLLSYALYCKSIKCVKYLLNNFGDIMDMDSDFNTYNRNHDHVIDTGDELSELNIKDINTMNETRENLQLFVTKGKTVLKSAMVAAIDSKQSEIIELMIYSNKKYILNTNASSSSTDNDTTVGKSNYKLSIPLLDRPINNRMMNSCFGDTHLLHVACSIKNTGLINYLLENGANIFEFGDNLKSPLLISCEKNHNEAIRALITHAAKMKHNIGKKILECVRISKWAQQNQANNDYEVTISQEKDHAQFVVARKNDPQLSYDEFMLLTRFEDDIYDTIVVWATEENKPEILEYILKLSFELGLLDSSKHEHTMLGEKPNGMGKPPLAIAISYNRNDIAKMLILKFNVDVDYCKSGNRYASILYMACLKGMTDVVLALLSYMKDLKKNIDVGYQFPNDGGHETPLMIASLKGHIDIVRILLKHGANTNAQNDEGRTALDIARNAKNDNVVRCIVGFNKSK